MSAVLGNGIAEIATGLDADMYTLGPVRNPQVGNSKFLSRKEPPQ